MRTLCVSAVILLAVSLVPCVYAGADIGLYGLGGRIGLVMPEDPIESTFGLGVQADLGTITKDIHLGAFIDYWGKSYDTGVDSDVSFSLFVFGATAKYFFQTQSKFEPYAGAGLGFAYGRSEFDSDYLGDASGSDTDLGFHLLGGFEYPLSSSMKGLVEAKYHLDGVDYLGIYAGITFPLGK